MFPGGVGEGNLSISSPQSPLIRDYRLGTDYHSLQEEPASGDLFNWLSRVEGMLILQL